METVIDFIFLGSKITADGDCSHDIKRCLLLGRKAMTNLDCILKNRDITLPTKVHQVKAMVFPVVRYGCESWTMNKAEHWRIDAFELVHSPLSLSSRDSLVPLHFLLRLLIFLPAILIQLVLPPAQCFSWCTLHTTLIRNSLDVLLFLFGTSLLFHVQLWKGRTDAEAETPILWLLDVKNWLIGSPDAPWCWERLKAGGEGDDRGWVGWMVSMT